jgi:hypothetical protein
MKNGKRILSVTIKTMMDSGSDTSYYGEYSNRSTSRFTIDRQHTLECNSQNWNQPQGEAWANLEHAVDHQYRQMEEREKVCFEKGEQDSKDIQVIDNFQETIDVLESLRDGECNCGESGDYQRNQYHYFNPSFNYVDSNGEPKNLTDAQLIQYIAQDYARMKELQGGNWWYVGIQAEAVWCVTYGTRNTDGNYTGGMGPQKTVTSGGLWGIESDSDDSEIADVEKVELDDLREQLEAIGFSSRAISQAFKNIERKDA